MQVDEKLIIFGGADRLQTHFNDIFIFDTIDWIKTETHGDIPTPRSGHAVVAYGKFMLLFGGIDFTEEADYNDLYVLNTGTCQQNIDEFDYFLISLLFMNNRYFRMEICWRIRC